LSSWFGLGPPFVIGGVLLITGMPLMFLWKAGHPEFFRVKRDPAHVKPPPEGGETAPRGAGSEWRRTPTSGEVILGYDGSDGARHAVRHAVEMASAFDAPLILAFGYEPPTMGGEAADLRKAVQSRGEAVLQEGAELVKSIDAELSVERVLIDERPADSLVDLAAQREARAHRRGTPGHGTYPRRRVGLGHLSPPARGAVPRRGRQSA